MLRVGLTGGIGAGKSTVAAHLVARGAVLIDADRIAREVVEPGTGGLAELVATFGGGILAGDGSLDRPGLAAVVFGEAAVDGAAARARLNAIVHPRVRRRCAELEAAAPADGIVVHDVPLLVEGGMAPSFPLVIVVHADVDERIGRLVRHRGMPEADARGRIAAQADDEARRAAADVWLDNGGAHADLTAVLDVLWDERLVAFEANLRARVSVPWLPALVAPDPAWAAAGRRLAARVAVAAGDRGRGVAHIGPTAVPGLPAQDVVDLQVGVDALADADALRDALQSAGFPRQDPGDRDHSGSSGSPGRHSHGSADPGRPVRLHVRETGSPEWRYALLLRDRLRADSALRAEYAQVERSALEQSGGDPVRCAATKQPWFDSVELSSDAWAASSGWEWSLT